MAGVGVLPARFHLPAMWEGFDQIRPDVYTPRNVSPTQTPAALDGRVNRIYARLRPGVSLQQSRAEMDLIVNHAGDEMQTRGIDHFISPGVNGGIDGGDS